MVVAVFGAMMAAAVGVNVLVMAALAEPRLDEQWPWDSSCFKHLTINSSMEEILTEAVLSAASTVPHRALLSPFIATDKTRSGG